MFLDQLARLGVINKVSTLAGPSSDDETEDEAKPEKVQKGVSEPCTWSRHGVDMEDRRRS